MTSVSYDLLLAREGHLAFPAAAAPFFHWRNDPDSDCTDASPLGIGVHPQRLAPTLPLPRKRESG